METTVIVTVSLQLLLSEVPVATNNFYKFYSPSSFGIHFIKGGYHFPLLQLLESRPEAPLSLVYPLLHATLTDEPCGNVPLVGEWDWYSIMPLLGVGSGQLPTKPTSIFTRSIKKQFSRNMSLWEVISKACLGCQIGILQVIRHTDNNSHLNNIH